jgi:Flp pilus assembly protein TadG
MIRRFLEDRSGASAVEFALIAPVLAAVVTAGWSLWWGQAPMETAKTALHAGAEYYDTGGTTDATATSLVNQAWSPKPSDGSVSSNRVCYCNGTATNCSTACPTGQTKTIYVTLSVAWTGQGAFAGMHQTEQEILRVQ